jgi:hypothetical protein
MTCKSQKILYLLVNSSKNIPVIISGTLHDFYGFWSILDDPFDPLTRHNKSGQPIYIFKSIFFFLLCFILVVGKLLFAQENAATAQLCEASTTAEAMGKPLAHQKKKHNLPHWSSRLAPMAILDPAWLNNCYAEDAESGGRSETWIEQPPCEVSPMQLPRISSWSSGNYPILPTSSVSFSKT